MSRKPEKPSASDGSPAAGAFDLSGLMGYRLARLSGAMGQLADREAGEVAGISLPEYRVLVVLANGGAQGIAALQQSMLIDKAWISRTFAKLVAKQLVVAEQDSQDARRTIFSLTASGRRAAQALIDRAELRQARILDGFSDREREQLFDFLTRLQRNVDDLGT